MSNIPTHWKPKLEQRIYYLEFKDEEYRTLLGRHERESFLDFADGRDALKCSLDLQPHGDPGIESGFHLVDDTPENHAAFHSAIADFTAA